MRKFWLLMAGTMGLAIHAGIAAAYDSSTVQGYLGEALSFPAASRFRAAGTAPSCSPAGSVLTPDTRQAKLDAINAAFSQLVATCQGRANELKNTLRQQTFRAENIAFTGGLLGVVSTIATCPHCAALFGGLAGLANPMQQTAEKYNDTPTATQAQLGDLSKGINDALTTYNALPVPSLCDTDTDFLTRVQKRVDALNTANLSCATYYRVATTGSSATAPGAPSGVSAKKNAKDPLAADVGFTAPGSDGNSKITGYKVYARPKSGGAAISATGTASPITVSGLTKGETYGIEVVATNAVGDGAPGVGASDYTVQ